MKTEKKKPCVKLEIVFNKEVTKSECLFEEEYEYCVLCGAKTDIPMKLSIDLRQNYVEGAGQLCDRCAHKLEKL